MNNLIIMTLTWITNITSNPLQIWTAPYADILGLQYFFGIFFGFIGGAIYVSSQDLPKTITFFIAISAFFLIVLPSIVAFIFGLLTALMISSILYRSLIEKRR